MQVLHRARARFNGAFIVDALCRETVSTQRVDGLYLRCRSRSMIVCRDAGFYFMHIPKNGGSSIKDQIKKYDLYEGYFNGLKQHETLGTVDTSHLPLKYLKAGYPEAYAVIAHLDGYAILRDPFERFASAVAQRFRLTHKIRPDQATDAQIKGELDAVLERLESNIPLIDRFCFFCPQHMFIEIDDTRMVKNIFHMHNLSECIEAISDRLGANLVADFHSNKTVTFKYQSISDYVVYLKDLSKKYLPPSLVDRLRKTALLILTEDRVNKIDQYVLESEDIKSYILEFYKKDFEIIGNLI
ncbi:MAG: hypothetical protein AAF607_03940 [Pseudomonadota bacterium]